MLPRRLTMNQAFSTRVEEAKSGAELSKELTAGEERQEKKAERRRQKKVKKEKKHEEKVRKANEENVKEDARATGDSGVKRDGETRKPSGVLEWQPHEMKRVEMGLGEKSQSRTANEGNERKILVRSLSDDKLRYRNADGNVVEVTYRKEDFHIVDLKLNKIYHDFFPSLPLVSGIGSVVVAGQSIFVLRVFYGEEQTKNQSLVLAGESSSSPYSHFHAGASHLRYDPSKDLKDDVGRDDGWAWGPAPFPADGPNARVFTFLHGDVYSFGYISPSPRVIHLASNNSAAAGWKSLGPLPPDLVDCEVNRPVIPDPRNNRILLLLYGGSRLPSPSLYAFYPPTVRQKGGGGGRWECIDPDFPYRERVSDVVLVGGILYLHGRKFPNLVRAYDVSNAKWLEVKWSTRVTEEGDFSIDDVDFTFDSLLCLDEANRVLCLAIYSPVSPSETVLYFFKFRAEQQQQHGTVCLTPLHKYEIGTNSGVLDFSLL